MATEHRSRDVGVMDAVKALAENVPFYCHKNFDADGSPKRLCAGYAIMVDREGGTDGE